MDNKQENELNYWRWLYSTKQDYIEFRKNDAKEKMKYFSDLIDRDGIGIDVGCGLISVFHGMKNNVIALDPLINGYNQILKVDDNIKYIEASGEEIPFPDKHFDYAFCVNVIDHTKNPDKMASEIKRVVKKGGKIYFEVNFDDELSPCHYSLWNEAMVKEMFGDLKCILKHKDRNDKDKQYLYHAIYENISANTNI